MSKAIRTGLHFDIRFTRIIRLHLYHLAAGSGAHFHCKAVAIFDYCLRNRRGKRAHQNRCCSDPVDEFAIAECHDVKILPDQYRCKKGPLWALLFCCVAQITLRQNAQSICDALGAIQTRPKSPPYRSRCWLPKIRLPSHQSLPSRC